MEEKSIIIKIKSGFKYLIISFLLSLLLVFCLSIVLCYTKTSENIIEPSIVFIVIISNITGSFFVGKKYKKNGIIYGALFGITYIMIMYFTSSIANGNFSIGIKSAIMIVLGIISGMIGGIIGVNLKN